MKSKLVLLSSLLGICIIAISFLSCSLYSEHQDFLKSQSDLVSAQQRLEQSQNDLKASRDESEKLRASAIDSTSKALAKDDKQLMETAAGIYFFNPQNRQSQKLDLRSDGTAYLSKFSGQYEMRPKKFTWKLDDDSSHVLMENEDSRMAFRIEGDDLIDSSENRWLRTR